MKKEFRAIAMRFNEQNWRDIVGKIESAGIKHYVWGIDEHGSYLVNNWGGEYGPYIGNCSGMHSVIQTVDKVYEEWDEAIFLEACGIDAEFDTFIITREQILQLDRSAKNKTNQLVSADLRRWFPKAFPTELVVGRWYKLPTFGNLMFMFSGGFGNDATYGFNYDGEFSDRIGVQRMRIEEYVLATDQEVKEALIKEANRRGLKKGVRINDIYNGKNDTDTITVSSNRLDYESVPLGRFQDKMALRDSEGAILFVDGQWADIIEQTLTLEQRVERIEGQIKSMRHD